MLKKHFNKFANSDEENLFVKYSPRGKKMSFANKNTNYVFFIVCFSCYFLASQLLLCCLMLKKNNFTNSYNVFGFDIFYFCFLQTNSNLLKF